MAYIRKKGQQLVLVHGERESGRVRQRVLFTIYSKAEALAVLGKRDDHNAAYFERLLEKQYPDLRFNWKAIRKAIEDKLDILPDLYQYKHERLEMHFREHLGACVKQLFLADPQHLVSSANLIQDHRYELELLKDLIDWRLRLCEQQESEWNRDNPFYWRFSLQGWGVPPETEEFVEGYFEKKDYRRAEAGFRLLVESFENYAEGYNYLGLIALDENRHKEAIEFFEKTIEVGRRLFPSRIAKKKYWSSLETRPYMRGLRNLTLTLNEAGRFDEALILCDRLEQECGDDTTAWWHRATCNLNLGRWWDSAQNAHRLISLQPEAALIEAFALDAMGERRQALTGFLHAALNHPCAVRMLLEIRVSKDARIYDGGRDHSAGIQLRRALHAYLSRPPLTSKRFFKQLLCDPRVEKLLDEVMDATRRWRKECPSEDRSAFDLMNLMRSPEFARAKAHELLDILGGDQLVVTGTTH